MSVHTISASTTGATHLPQVTEPRNAGLPLDLNWVLSAQANTSAIERRAASLPALRQKGASGGMAFKGRDLH
jgi:deoxyribose-phosphate aldolase